MKAYIYTGGQLLRENITEHPSNEDLCIAADSGYEAARALGERIDVIIGDFDSFDSVSIPSGIERITLPCEKDVTDTQAAVELALERGCEDIVIVGGIGTRLDHTLSNLGILRELRHRGAHAYITNGFNRVRYIENDSLLVAKSAYKYLSLLSAGKICRGVSIEGCKYPLKNYKLSEDKQFAVSNEIMGNVALVSVKKGGLFVIESRDK